MRSGTHAHEMEGEKRLSIPITVRYASSTALPTFMFLTKFMSYELQSKIDAEPLEDPLQPPPPPSQIFKEVKSYLLVTYKMLGLPFCI